MQNGIDVRIVYRNYRRNNYILPLAKTGIADIFDLCIYNLLPDEKTYASLNSIAKSA